MPVSDFDIFNERLLPDITLSDTYKLDFIVFFYLIEINMCLMLRFLRYWKLQSKLYYIIDAIKFDRDTWQYRHTINDDKCLPVAFPYTTVYL